MPLELDHVFVAVQPDAPQIAQLAAAGFQTAETREHVGQGTASSGVFFENAYVEFIWLLDRREAESAAIRRTRLAERLDPKTTASPFGCGLRGHDLADEPLPFATWDYRAPYLPEGVSIPMGDNSGCLAEPLLFHLPWKDGPGFRCPRHPNGSRAITRVTLGVEQYRNPSPQLEAFALLDLVAVNLGSHASMVVEVDGGRQGATMDLRPDVPFVIHW
jgi:hypothetical protein